MPSRSILYLGPWLMAAAAACVSGQQLNPPITEWRTANYWAPTDAIAVRMRAEHGSEIAHTSGASAPLAFVAMKPCRVVDTRSDQGQIGAFGPPALVANSPRTFVIPSQTTCNVPSAYAYSLNFTVVASGPVSFLSAWPDDQPYPNTSVLNLSTAGVIANAIIVPAGANGGIQVLAGNPTQLIIDVNGYFIPNPGGITLPYTGSVSAPANAVFTILNTAGGIIGRTPFTPDGMLVQAGGGNAVGQGATGGTGITAVAGNGALSSSSSTPAGTGGTGISTTGGSGGGGSNGASSGDGGTGLNADGGAAFFGGSGGAGVVANGGAANSGIGGRGITATGGAGGDGYQGGVGVYAIGGTGGSNAIGGVALYAVAGTGPNGYGYAANFVGTITKTAGSFRIDHPLDPAHKYLSHSFVESPDMMNIYNGNVRLDSRGAAWVELPAWFESLNGEFRYQLTAIGTPSPGLYIAEEVRGNRFKIAGGRPGAKVSWTVTGVRRDAYANAHRIPVEELKPPSEQNKYLHPELFGEPPDRAVYYTGPQPREPAPVSSTTPAGRNVNQSTANATVR